MPPPALATPAGAARPVWGVAMDDVEFPRSAASLPDHRGGARGSVVAASKEVSPFEAGAGAAQKRKRKMSDGSRETACGLSYAFRGSPLAPFCAPEIVRGDTCVTEGQNSFSFETAAHRSLESASLSGADSAVPAPAGDTSFQRLADLPSIPVGSLLLGVVAEVHSDDILVHLPDGLVGWVPRAHAFPSLEDLRGRSGSDNTENGSGCVKRCRRDAPSDTAAAGGNESSPRGGDDATGRENTRETGARQRARVSVGKRAERLVSLAAHYVVGQVVQCVVIAEGGNECSQTPRRVRRGDGQTLVLSLRPSIFNAGLTAEAIQPGMVLPASLSSVEDHGYVFSVGIKGLSAFLSSPALPACGSPRAKTPADQATTAASSSPLRLPLHTIVSLRVDSVNAAAKVLLCSLPGTEEHRSKPSESRNELARRQREPYLSLPKAVAWAAVKPGCLVEARVQELYDWRGRAEKHTNSGAFTKHTEGKKSSLLKGNEDVNERASQNANDVIGVRVVCMGGDIFGTLLQPHFGHPLLQLESNLCSDFAPHVADTGTGGRMGSKEAVRKAAEEEGTVEGHGGNGRGPRSGRSSETCVRSTGGANGERKLTKEAGGTLSETARDSAPSVTRFDVIRARYSRACTSRVTHVGARIFARVTCVLSSTTRHVYLSMLPHIMMWRPCQLPCSVTELLPGRRLLGEAARIISVYPAVDVRSQRNYALKKRWSSSSHAGDGDGEVRVLLQKRCDEETPQQKRRGQPKKEECTRVSAEAAGDSCRSHDVDGKLVTRSSEGGTTDISEQRVLCSHTSAECEMDWAVSTEPPKNEPSLCSLAGEQGQSCSWLLVRMPRCMMATRRESSSFEGRRNSGGRKRMEAETKTKHNLETALIDLAPGDVLWSASQRTEGGSCFCRVLYFDRFAAEVVGGNAPRLLKDSVILTPFDVSPGQVITVSVLRWRLPAEFKELEHNRRQRRLQAPPAGIFVRLSPYLTAFVPLCQLTDTPVSSFPPHVVPGSSLKLRVLERECCRSCTDLDRDATFAPFMGKRGHKGAVKRRGVADVNGVSILPHPYLRGGGNFDSDERACGSSVMGMGGGGGGRLVLTGKKSFLRDPHPLSSILAPSALGGRVNNGHTCCLHAGLIALGYVQKLVYQEAVRSADERRGGVEGSEEGVPSITVGFYNGLTGRLSQDEVRRAVVEEGRTFKLGTVVKVRVLGVDTKCRCLRVTMDMSEEVKQVAIAAARRKEEKFTLRLYPGGIVEKQRLTLLALTDEGVFVAVEEKREGDTTRTSSDATESADGTREAAVAARSRLDKSRGWERQRSLVAGLGFIPKMHLSDGVRLAEELHSVLRVGKKFPLDAVVLSSAATVRPGAALEVWEPRTASLKKGNILSRKGSAGPATFGLSRGGIQDALDRVKEALQQHSAVKGDGKQKEDAYGRLIKDVNILSCKPTLRASATNGTFLRDSKAVEKLKTKLRSSPPILWGYVRKIGAYGLLVSFGAWQLTGLLPYSNISDAFIEDENHLRQLYREGMTVRGCLVAVSDAVDEDCEQQLSSGADARNRIVGASGKRGALRFLVDIRPKRLSDLQRHQRLEGGAKSAASVGIQMLRGLFEHKAVAAMLKQSRDSHGRLAESSISDSVGPDESMHKKASLAPESVGDSMSLHGADSTVCLRPGQLVWGRILPQDFPNCVLLELQLPRRVEHNSKGRFYSVRGVTGVVLEHQLPEGETIESLRARGGEGAHQDPMPCIVLDFDPVTGIADVSCRRRLVNPLHVAHNAVEAAARRQECNFVHYVLVGVTTPASSDQKAKEVCDTPPGTEGAVGRESARKQRVEVVTQDLGDLFCGDTAAVENQSESTSFSPSAVIPSCVEARGVASELNATAQRKEAFSLPFAEAIPEKVIKRVQSFCEAHPARCATVQLESAAYSVLAADFDVVVYFSKSKRVRQERLEALLSCATHSGSGGEAVKPLRVMPDGSVRVNTLQMNKSATQLGGSSYVVDGLHVRLPLLLFSISCRNNTLLPVQPTAEALQEAPEDAGWCVALSPVQRSFCWQSGTPGVSVLLVGGCWPMRGRRLEQHGQRNSTPSQCRARAKGTDGFGENTDSVELRNNTISAEKKLSATELDDVIERAAAPGQILRARITHVGACVALARLKTPKQQLLLRLHAADALPLLSVKRPQVTVDADDSVYEEKEARHALPQGEEWKDRASQITETQPLGSSADELGGTTSAGEEQRRGADSGRTGWFPPVLSRSTSSTDCSPSCSNPLKRLTAGMLVDVKVLRLREVYSLSGDKAEKVDLSEGARGRNTATCDEHCIGNNGEGKNVTNEKNKHEGEAVRNTKNQWVADVELVGLIEKRRAPGRIGRTHYTHVSTDVGASLTSSFVDGTQEFSADGAESQCEDNISRNRLAWLYSPRWAVVEAVCDRYLIVHCGVRSELLCGLSLQQTAKSHLYGKEPTKSRLSDEGHEYTAAFLSGRGRVHRLDATRDRRVLQNLRVGFAPGDMVCVRLLPILTLGEAAFEEAIESITRAAGRADEKVTREDDTTLDTQHFRRNSRRTASFGARYTLVASAAASAQTLSLDTAHAEDEATVDESSPALPARACETVPFSLVETSFETMAYALDAWARWRYSPGMVCWGVVHHMLPPPFAVAVQVCEVVIKRSFLPLLKRNSETSCERDYTQVHDEDDELQTSGVKVSSGGRKDSVVHLPVLAAVHLTEITDAWQSDPVRHLKLSVGQLVKVRIMPILNAEHAQQQLKHKKTESRSGLPLEASMRMSVVEKVCKPRPSTGENRSRLLTFDQLKVGDHVSGYVISTGDAGVFVAMNRCLTLRIRLQNLSCPMLSLQDESQRTHPKVAGVVTGAQAQELYPVGKALRGIRVVELQPDSRRIEGSLKDDAVGFLKRRRPVNAEHTATNKRPKAKTPRDVDRLCSDHESLINTPVSSGFDVGDVCEGRVKAVESFGVFVSLLMSPSRRSGRDAKRMTDALCHVSDIGGTTEEERTITLGKLKVGDLVKARVTRTDKVTGRIWISLDTSVFESEDDKSEEELCGAHAEAASGDMENYSETLGGITNTLKGTIIDEYANTEMKRSYRLKMQKEGCTNTKSHYPVEESSCAWSTAISGIESESDEAYQGREDHSAEQKSAIVRDGQNGGHSTRSGLRRTNMFEKVEEMCEDASKNLNWQEKDDQRRKREEEIRLAEEENSYRSWMENPRTPEDFEKLVLVSGNSAAVWIGYMAYYLKLGDLARARQIAERAVVHINYREEQQRLDVWVAYLNMECVYGDAVETIFRRAIQYNDAKKIYYQMTFIFEKARKLTEARSACESCCARFPESQKMWVRHLTLLYTSLKDVPAARELMLQALLRLPRRKHVAFAASCARLEYKFGSKERGQTYFEKLLAEHPKRTDLWSQYMDAHIVANTPPRCPRPDLQSIRLLFERATSLQLKPRKMKFLFTRWLLFEKQHGTVDGQSLVRARAREYIQAMEARLIERQHS